MTYEQALAYIHGTLKFDTKKIGLDNVTHLLRFMGNPHQKLKYIHVGGTNGKGSTTAMIASILKAQGYKVGMYTSPYIEEFTERIQVDGQHIYRNDLARITAWVKELIEEMTMAGYTHPTEFEIVTAIAFAYYHEQQCDFVVIEVGMGGLLDATNVIASSMVTVITSISMDHTEYLGNTIEAIAEKKSGIIKKNGVVVVYPQLFPEAYDVLCEKVRQQEATLVDVGCQNTQIISSTLAGSQFTIGSQEAYEIPLIGDHQVLNAVTAITAIKMLYKHHNVKIENHAIKQGLKQVKWPGRFELICQKPLFIVDGGHNISGIQMLKNTLLKYVGHKKMIFIMGMLSNKEYQACVREIVPLANQVITTTPNHPNALEAKALSQEVKKYASHVCAASNSEEAVKMALKDAGDNDVICTFGSLYLIGEIKKNLREIL